MDVKGCQMDEITDHYFAYSSAFAELKDTMLALRRFLVTLKLLGILQANEVQPLFRALQRKYFNAHMKRQVLGVVLPPDYVPRKKSEGH
jgi:hypothetical protein